MGDDSFIISWGADEEGHPADPHPDDRRHRQGRDPSSALGIHGPELDHQPGVEDHPCAICGEEHRAQLAALEAQVQKWKQRADEYEIKAGLNERHLNDVKQSRMELRQQVAALQAELERARRPWWKRK